MKRVISYLFNLDLFVLLESIILAPDFLNDITNKEIDEDFVSKINELDEKLIIFQSSDLPDSSAIDEIIPEMRKTLAKVCSKIYTLILNKFQMLNKPNTNIPILQQNILMKNKILILFLKKHAIAMYNDLISKYVTLVDKIYQNLSKNYFFALNKLTNDKQDKFSLIYSEELSR